MDPSAGALSVQHCLRARVRCNYGVRRLQLKCICMYILYTESRRIFLETHLSRSD